MTRHALFAAVSGHALARAFASGMATTPEAVAAARAAYQSGATMPGDEMTKRSTDSAAMVEYWDLSDALVDGVQAMRDLGEKYLPKFVDEDSDGYKYRLALTKMTNVYRDIVESLASKPFEQEIELVKDENKSIPDEMEQFITNVDGSGNDITAFASHTFFNGINSAIDWIFVDSPKIDPNKVRSVADAKRAGIRPYWSHVLGRNVLEAKSQVIDGSEALTYVRILEPGKPDHVRVMERFGDAVTFKLYVKTDRLAVDGKTAFILEDEGTIGIDEIPLVPFYTGRRDGRTWRFFPVMRDAADLQVELYQSESGLKFAKTLTAYPMLAGNGISPIKNADNSIKKLAVGPNKVLYGPRDGSGNAGSWAYVEPSATSLKFLGDDIKDTIQLLREIGRQPLTAQSGNITVITAAYAANKAKSAVGAWAIGLKGALEYAMKVTCKFKNIAPETYDPKVFVYAEFDAFVEGKDTETLDADRDRGDISRETLLEEKKRRGIYSPEFTIEREEERLLKEGVGPGDDNPDNITKLPQPTPPKPKVVK